MFNIGMDLSSGQLRVATKHDELRQVQFIEGDASCTGFRNESFDKVFITHALHEMPRDVRLSMLAEARRVLRKHGHVIILELDNPKNLFLYEKLFYTIDKIPQNKQLYQEIKL